jgi:arabinose-5-phosphate isomerase
MEGQLQKASTEKHIEPVGQATQPNPGDDHLAVGLSVIRMEADGLHQLADFVGESFGHAVEMILRCRQRVIVSGIGKSGHVARKIAATLAATGTPALFVHAAEAAHGDVGMISSGDVLIVFSNSGATVEVQPLCIYAKAIGCSVIGISRNANSLLMRTADVGLLLPKVEEACTSSLAPTTSTTMMLALGDALAVATMRARGLSGSDIRALHPGGEIGLHLRSVEDVMHAGDRMPLVSLSAPMPDVLLTMTEKRLGIAGVIDEQGELVGIITDGDLRRCARNVVFGTAGDVMTDAPRTILRTARVQDALELMNTHRITVLFVVDERQPRVPLGAVQIYDIAVPPAPAPTLGGPR